MSTTMLTVHHAAPSRKGSRQFTYGLTPEAAVDQLVSDRFPGALVTFSAHGTVAYLWRDDRFIADVEIEVIS